MTKIHTDDWIDAQEMANRYPSTFSAPSLEELEMLSVGDITKVARRGVDDESGVRFWTVITEINGQEIIAEVNNCLIDDGLPYNAGDKVAYQKRHIYACYEKWFIEDYLRVPLARIYQKICLGCNQIATIQSKREIQYFEYDVDNNIKMKVSYLECDNCKEQYADPEFDFEKYKKLAVEELEQKLKADQELLDKLKDKLQ
jgi:hypothetical protein